MKTIVLILASLFFCSSQILSQPTWSWLYPKPQGGDFNSVSFVDVNTGWAVGGDNNILKTTDAGDSWSWQFNSDYPHRFTGVFFTDSDNGTVVGLDGRILKTTDGGNTWLYQISGTTVTLTKVFFNDTNNGIVVGGSGTILRTTDGGNIWTVQTSGTTASLFSVSFANSDHGLVVGLGGTILKTTDGGINWINISVVATTNFHSVSYIDINNATIVTSIGTILKTTDGGGTWSIQYSGTIILQSVSFFDINNGIVVGNNGLILKTTNGGLNWSNQTSGTPGFLNFVSFIDLNNVIVTGDGTVSTIPTGDLLKSTDGGNTWVNKIISVTNAVLRDVSFLNEYTAVTVGNSGTILITTDAGITWNHQSSGTARNLNSVDFYDANFGTAVGSNGTILRTTNGGSDWFAQFSGTTRSLNEVCAFDENNILVAGDNGTILKTTNGGTNWNIQSTSITQALRSVTYLDVMTAVAVGSGATILKSTDGGINWIIKASGVSSTITLFDVHFINSTTGTTVGGLPTILKTTDGGESWILQDLPISGVTFFEGVEFSDINNGTAIGNNGVILQTTNGGLDWVKHPLLGSNIYRGIELFDGFTGIVVGDWGIIMGMENSSTPNTAPGFIFPTPVCGSTLTAEVGLPLSFIITAEDVDAGDLVTLSASGLPSGSVMNPLLPGSGNPVTSDFSWTPDLASVGVHSVTFEIEDNLGEQSTCTFNIEVLNNNIAPSFVSPTPMCGTSLSVTLGSPITFTVKAEDPDSWNSVELSASGMPSSSMMNPVLPLSGNPVSSDFSWTPTASDIGLHEVVFTAVDNISAFVSCVITINVEDIPEIVCPLNQLYWRENPVEWPVETLLLGTLNDYEKPELLSILELFEPFDASVVLAQQLIAAKLNVANSAPVPIVAADAITNADNAIGELIIPARIRFLSALGRTMVRQALILWAYNNNLLTPDCISTLTKQMAKEDEIQININDYTLFDNYPNPFNPSTRITFAIPNTELVTLKVFNTIGEEVMTLVNEEKSPGIYEVEFNAATLPSGVYIYRLKAGEFNQTKKMILMK